MACYDLLEFVCCGSVGVVGILVAFNALNFVFDWTTWSPYASGGVVTVGVLTPAWHQGAADGEWNETEPRAVLEYALASVSARTVMRDRHEAASLRCLQAKELCGFQAAQPDGATQEDASPDNPTLACSCSDLNGTECHRDMHRESQEGDDFR
ncbi:hypothetical protein PI124_g23136 [Phytophthora idaei]|nr:hypothetical protein PI125_g25080 [Phytophthora idaei]KAG3124876.1 hypothetical protein PI126_g23040 [Phytophthora idaei]KAG3231769.1 hypothetical protein PI124_g23136 [Phytophthora idaei]